MLDVLSEGRIISGFVRGTGMEYHSMRANPAYSRERFWEAHDLILKAWTDDGPFAWKGKHFDVPYVNPWPRPYQQPHPPIWLPGTGSVETITEAAKRRYPFMMVFAPLSFTKVNYEMYRRAANDAGYEASPEQLAFCVPTYVAETDERAHAGWLPGGRKRGMTSSAKRVMFFTTFQLGIVPTCIDAPTWTPAPHSSA